ncbi:MAG TPA: class I SAM-dependent methyltransferase, partial [Acidobacteriota bacterium]|nr:class I SAM-dependent methyltransferase [Acidobacteriota bacterium]
WVVWSRALRFLLPGLTVADFGCGDGAFTVEIARWARRVFAVDSNPAFLKLAREAARGFSNIEFLEEDMHQVPLEAECVELVVISQSLHYARRPVGVIAEAHRILAPEGRILLIELFPHDEEWVTSELGHGWLGFDPVQIEAWMRESGFRKVESDAHFKRAHDTFQPFITTARK